MSFFMAPIGARISKEKSTVKCYPAHALKTEKQILIILSEVGWWCGIIAERVDM